MHGWGRENRRDWLNLFLQTRQLYFLAKGLVFLEMLLHKGKRGRDFEYNITL